MSDRREYQRAYYLKNKEKINSRNNAHYKKKMEDPNERAKRRSQLRQNHLKNPEIAFNSNRKYRQENREKCRAKCRCWRENNKQYDAFRSATRRSNRRKATPVWANLKAIAEFYENCPEGYHVDHIVPLRGKSVCGLHTLENLQYLPAEDNLKKHNRFPYVA